MLPFLKSKDKSVAGLIIQKRNPDQEVEVNESEDYHAEAIEACAEALIEAVHNKDVKATAQAIKDAFDILDAMPHVEGPHEEGEIE